MSALPTILDELAHDPHITDILINNGVEVWYERLGSLHRGDDLIAGTIEAHIERVLAPLGRRLDRLSPMVDARLPDGTRMCAVVPPIAVGGTCAAFRLFHDDVRPLRSFCATDDTVDELLSARGNVLVSGATGSGKTSLVASLRDHLASTERLVIIEDTRELPVRGANSVRLEARPANEIGRAHV